MRANAVSTLRRLTLAALLIGSAACSPSAPAPATSLTPSPTAPSSSTDRAGSPEPPQAGSSPTAADRSHAVLERFFQVTSADDVSFHLDQDAVLSFPGTESRPSLITYDLDVSGDDAAGSFLIEGQTIEVVVVGDDAWVRQGAGAWTQTTRAAAGGDDIVDVFRYVGGIDDLEFVGLRSSNSEDWFRYRAVRRLPYITGSMRDSGGTGELTSLDLYVLESGVPRQMEFSFEASQPSANGDVSVEGRTQVVLTRWGEPIDIEPPE